MLREGKALALLIAVSPELRTVPGTDEVAQEMLADCWTQEGSTKKLKDHLNDSISDQKKKKNSLGFYTRLSKWKFQVTAKRMEVDGCWDKSVVVLHVPLSVLTLSRISVLSARSDFKAVSSWAICTLSCCSFSFHCSSWAALKALQNTHDMQRRAWRSASAENAKEKSF